MYFKYTKSSSNWKLHTNYIIYNVSYDFQQANVSLSTSFHIFELKWTWSKFCVWKNYTSYGRSALTHNASASSSDPLLKSQETRRFRGIKQAVFGIYSIWNELGPLYKFETELVSMSLWMFSFFSWVSSWVKMCGMRLYHISVEILVYCEIFSSNLYFEQLVPSVAQYECQDVFSYFEWNESLWY